MREREAHMVTATEAPAPKARCSAGRKATRKEAPAPQPSPQLKKTPEQQRAGAAKNKLNKLKKSGQMFKIRITHTESSSS